MKRGEFLRTLLNSFFLCRVVVFGFFFYFIFFCRVHGQLNLALYAVCDLRAGNVHSYYASRTMSAVSNKIKRMVES